MIATRLSPHPVCVSLPSAVSLLQGPCLSLTKRGYLCPLFTAEERDTAHPPSPSHFTPPVRAFSVCFLSSLFFCPPLSFTFPSPRFNHRLVLTQVDSCYIVFFLSSSVRCCSHDKQDVCSFAWGLLFVMWVCFVCDRSEKECVCLVDD